MPSELKKLADYLIDPNSTQNAIALLRDPQSNIKHAVLLYDYDVITGGICGDFLH